MNRKKQDPYLVKARQGLQIRLKDPELLEAAMTHPSWRNENPPKKLDDFDRMEFFGDAILNFVICCKLYVKFPEADEGLLSRLRSILVSRKILARLAKKIRLSSFIRIGKSLREQQDFPQHKILADSLEALIAAIYLDCGFDAVRRFILRLYDGLFDSRKLFRLDPNPKSTLQEISQKNWQKIPIYTNRPLSNGLIQSLVTIDRRRNKKASARTRKEAEEKAARDLIRKIRQELLRRSKKVSSGRKLRKIF
ncbi:MAG: ribonuclease III [Candidatus Omnitrophica bacterium]|nr:ribonuclease III [Candidatus Omnitrophota bacterium]